MLAKEPDQRYQVVHDVKTDLAALIEEIADSTGEVETGPLGVSSTEAGWRRALPWSIAVVAVVIAVSIAFWSSPQLLSPPLTTFVINPSVAAPLTSFASNELAISPDGRHLLYRVNIERGVQLYLHSLDDLVERPIP